MPCSTKEDCLTLTLMQTDQRLKRQPDLGDSPRRLCSVSATEEGLIAALAAARAVVNNTMLASSDEMSRVATATP